MNTTVSESLRERCENICELCTAEKATIAYAVSPKNNDAIENEVAICNTCNVLLNDTNAASHWQCLAGSVWNSNASVQALTYRILYNNKEQEWASEIINSVELDETVTNWALSAFEVKPVHRDANGIELNNGDNVVLTQVLNVKGANFMAPKGTIVKKIKLVPDNAEQIEGKINEQTIVILTKFVRRN